MAREHAQTHTRSRIGQLQVIEGRADRWSDEIELPSDGFGAVCDRDPCTIAAEVASVQAAILAVEAACATR